MKNNIPRVLLYQLFVTIMFSGLLFLPQLKEQKARLVLYLWGASLLVALNYALHHWAWFKVYNTKQTGSVVFSVVFKYALLGFILWWLSPLERVSLGFLVLGVLCNTLAVIVYGMSAVKKEK